MWLPWEFGAAGAVICALIAVAARPLGQRSLTSATLAPRSVLQSAYVPISDRARGDRARGDRATSVSAVATELAIMLALYATWRLLNTVEPITADLERAFARGRQIWELERTIGIGTERWLQRQTMRSSLLTQFANGYYAIAHVPVTIAFLLWMFFRRRERYLPWRRLLAWFTLFGVAVRLVAVAPPRLMPDLGFADTPAMFDQSVYGPIGSGVSDQFAAMPSIHVGWAVLVGIAVWRLGRGVGRLLGPLHLLLTALAVVVTGNHWWLDGLAAAAMLAVISPFLFDVRRGLARDAPDHRRPHLP